MPDLGSLRAALDGDLHTPGTAGYEAVRRPQNPAFGDVRPGLVVVCRSEQDVVRAVRYARAERIPLVPRGGGHCFAGRSTTDGMVLDLSPLDAVVLEADGAAVIGAGARLGAVYRALGAAARTLPAGCGATVGIAGLTLGGGIGLLGRSFGLTCDRLIAARVVLADGELVDCDVDRHPELFWALRGAGGGQFGIVVALTFATIPEPAVFRIDARWDGDDVGAAVRAWQQWAPDAPDGLTADLTVERTVDDVLRARLFGVSLLSEGQTRDALGRLAALLPAVAPIRLGGTVPYTAVKTAVDDDDRSSAAGAIRIRSEFFSGSLGAATIDALLRLIRSAGAGAGTTRRLTFTAMAGAYNRVAEEATAFAHRGQRFLLEHVGAADDPWVDASWSAAHPDGAGRVYPNFPDPSLRDPLSAYHGANAARLAAVKRRYDPDALFWFEQAIRPGPPGLRAHDDNSTDDNTDPTEETA